MQPKPCVTEQFNKRVNFRASKSCFLCVCVSLKCVFFANLLLSWRTTMWRFSFSTTVSPAQNQHKLTEKKKTKMKRMSEKSKRQRRELPCYLFKYGVCTWAWMHFIAAQLCVCVCLFSLSFNIAQEIIKWIHCNLIFRIYAGMALHRFLLVSKNTNAMQPPVYMHSNNNKIYAPIKFNGAQRR